MKVPVSLVSFSAGKTIDLKNLIKSVLTVNLFYVSGDTSMRRSKSRGDGLNRH